MRPDPHPDRATTPLVSLEGAVSLISAFPALAGVDFSVAAGEIVLLHGPNGAGKTTLLRLCAGLCRLDRGEGHVMGHDLRRRQGRLAVRRSVAYLAHQTSLYADLTVADNIRFWTRANRSDDIEPILDLLGLNGRLLDVPVAGLSAGQRRRTALAIVAARRSPLWLLDEPHTGFDAEGRDLLDDLLRRAAGAGAGVVLSSHESDRAATLADREVAIIGGHATDASGGSSQLDPRAR